MLQVGQGPGGSAQPQGPGADNSGGEIVKNRISPSVGYDRRGPGQPRQGEGIQVGKHMSYTRKPILTFYVLFFCREKKGSLRTSAGNILRPGEQI